MGDSAEKQTKTSFTQGLKSEYKKITWPDRQSTLKQSAAVAVTTIILGIIIALLDYVVKYGVDFLIKL